MIFQDPFACLHPMYRVGDQIVEAVHAHATVSKSKARDRAVELLDAVGIPQRARDRARDYPHQFSGGMRQRVMIAMALVNNPSRAHRGRADDRARRHGAGADPRADRAGQARVRHRRHPHHARPRGRRGDGGHRRSSCTRAGRWSTGPARDVFAAPQHPYTWGLLGSMPTIERRLEQPCSRSRARRRRSSSPALAARSIHAARTRSSRCRVELPAAAARSRTGTSIAATCPTRREARRSGPMCEP